MSGTLSRTATASSRGGVGRKLEAKFRPEEHELYTRHRNGGRGVVGTQSPMTSGPTDVYAAGVEGRSRVLPWETCQHAAGRINVLRSRAHRTQMSRPFADAHIPLKGANKMCRLFGKAAREVARRTDVVAGVSSGHKSHVQVAKGQTQGGVLMQRIRFSRRRSPREEEPERPERQVAEPPMARYRASNGSGMQ
jgi:hypothetical protein